MDEDELIAYYANLLIIQYNCQEKAKAHIELIIRTLNVLDLLIAVRDGFDIETAVGNQLDILGKYIGVDRFYTEETFEGTFFGFADNSGNAPSDVTGFADNADFLTKDGSLLSVDDILALNNRLTDENYRILLKLKILQNNINHSAKSIDDALFQTFGTDIFMVDNYSMTITYFVVPSFSLAILAALQKEVIPRPMAVAIQGVIPLDTYFGFADNNGEASDDITGFSDNADFLTKGGKVFSAEDFITV